MFAAVRLPGARAHESSCGFCYCFCHRKGRSDVGCGFTFSVPVDVAVPGAIMYHPLKQQGRLAQRPPGSGPCTTR